MFYDSTSVPRIKGARRELRRQIARQSERILAKSAVGMMSILRFAHFIRLCIQNKMISRALRPDLQEIKSMCRAHWNPFQISNSVSRGDRLLSDLLYYKQITNT
ncbi:MAG: hypothetical protein ACI8ZZ_002668 [Gammaproteobacteria bacterium]